MTTDLDDVFTGKRVRREKASDDHFVDNLISAADFSELRLSRFNVREAGHLSDDIDREWTTQTNHSESAATSGSG